MCVRVCVSKNERQKECVCDRARERKIKRGKRERERERDLARYPALARVARSDACPLAQHPVCECVCDREREGECVCDGEREREAVCVIDSKGKCACVIESERESVCERGGITSRNILRWPARAVAMRAHSRSIPSFISASFCCSWFSCETIQLSMSSAMRCLRFTIAASAANVVRRSNLQHFVIS